MGTKCVFMCEFVVVVMLDLLWPWKTKLEREVDSGEPFLVRVVLAKGDGDGDEKRREPRGSRHWHYSHSAITQREKRRDGKEESGEYWPVAGGLGVRCVASAIDDVLMPFSSSLLSLVRLGEMPRNAKESNNGRHTLILPSFPRIIVSHAIPRVGPYLCTSFYTYYYAA